MYYLISETLEETDKETALKSKKKYVAVLTPGEWQAERDSFEMGIDLDLQIENPPTTMAQVNIDSLTGTFLIPDRNNISSDAAGFAFALDERGIVFIDRSGAAEKYIRCVRSTRHWKRPGLARFLYDFLEEMVAGDMDLLDHYESRLDVIEEAILQDNGDTLVTKVNDIRSQLLIFFRHYNQLIDLGEELEENENNFFDAEGIRYFHMYTSRIMRLLDIVNALREYTTQVRDLYHSQLDIRMNRIMTVLTVVTAIFMPLTLIVGWYGMNFKYMPELDKPWAYPLLFLVSLLILLIGLWYFRKKKWL